MNKKSLKQSTFVFIVFLSSGLLIGLGLSWAVYSAPPNSLSARPTPSATDNYLEFATSQPENTPSIAIVAGKSAPDFILRNLNGDEIRLSDFTGKPVMIKLWASWCQPCLKEMPVIEAIYKKYQSVGLVVLGINVTSQDKVTDVKETVNHFNLSYPILIDESGHVSELYQMRGIPTSFFIDSQGIIRRIQIGEILPEYMDRYLEEIIPDSDS